MFRERHLGRHYPILEQAIGAMPPPLRRVLAYIRRPFTILYELSSLEDSYRRLLDETAEEDRDDGDSDSGSDGELTMDAKIRSFTRSRLKYHRLQIASLKPEVRDEHITHKYILGLLADALKEQWPVNDVAVDQFSDQQQEQQQQQPEPSVLASDHVNVAPAKNLKRTATSAGFDDHCSGTAVSISASSQPDSGTATATGSAVGDLDSTGQAAAKRAKLDDSNATLPARRYY